jgi:tetratricopeptide (TPR) repeat protein
LWGLENRRIQELSQEIQTYGKLAELHLERAKLYIQIKEYQKANNDLNKAIVLNPELEDSQILLAEVLLEEEQLNESKKLLDRLLGISKNETTRMRAHFLLGDVYRKMDNQKEALRYYEKVLHTNLSHEQIHYLRLADSYYEDGDFRRSINVLKTGMNTMIEKDLLRLKMADISMEEGSYSLALSVLDEMIKEDKNNAKLYYKRADIFKEQGKLKEMEREIKKAKLTLLKK